MTGTQFGVNLIDVNMGSAEVAASLPQQELATALSRGDTVAAAACFAREGCLITPDRTAVHGRDRIRVVLAQLVATEIEVDVNGTSTVATDDALLARERWTIRTGAEDARLEQTVEPVFVLAPIEGVWRLAIAAIWG